MSNIKTLNQLLTEELGKRSIEKTQLPRLLTDNLNPIFVIRPYQNKAFQYFLNYWQESFDNKPRHNHQLLFHMATGSGKTLMMAGVILYLYEQGYRNFLFFVNSTNVINKTRDNFLNAISRKFLFANDIRYGDKQVNIREVSNFQTANNNDINIVFSTIQGLHMSLNTPRENGITYDDFEAKKIVLISDEAHHINADTKKAGKATTDDFFETLSWEGTVERIFKAHEDNVLLEFTATMDLSEDNLAEKYNPKLIYDYPLREFRKDGYSKEVKVLQADLQPFDRAMQAILLNQYRRKIFEKYKKPIKPVILFKSKSIKESLSFFEEFKTKIKQLNQSTLENLKSNTTITTLKNMFVYFDINNITLDNLVAELKEDFSEDKLILVNSKEESESKQIAINSLEEEKNEYRAVFAVDKLNEGWDVLNLFDIVRMYDTRDAKSGKVGKTTMSEAQLIGRGARYCPFKITEDQPMYGRKFDADLDNELRVCEELYYHSAYNPKYIQELNTALQEIGIVAKNTTERKINLKESFKATPLYKAGHIYLNSRMKYNRKDITELDSTIINQRHKITLVTGYTKSTIAFDMDDLDKSGVGKKSKDYDLINFGETIIYKAVQRLDFYKFDNLKKYLPNLKSIHELVTSESYLGKITLEVTGTPKQVNNLSPEEKLIAATRILNSISEIISSEKIEYKGTKKFTPFMIKDTFTDKTLNFMIDEGGDKEFGMSMNNQIETAYHLNLNEREWYAFNDCYGTSEEKMLIQFIDKRFEELKKKYTDAYLVRNERHFKLYNFIDGRALEPDFVLFLVGKENKNTIHYQVFIEPKGSHLLKSDEWKEKFLINLKDSFELEQLFANKKYAIWGLPFYNSDNVESEFSPAFDSSLL